MEDKMAAGAFGRAMNYGCDGPNYDNYNNHNNYVGFEQWLKRSFYYYY